jgi:hypothetical protein
MDGRPKARLDWKVIISAGQVPMLVVSCGTLRSTLGTDYISK